MQNVRRNDWYPLVRSERNSIASWRFDCLVMAGSFPNILSYVENLLGNPDYIFPIDKMKSLVLFQLPRAFLKTRSNSQVDKTVVADPYRHSR